MRRLLLGATLLAALAHLSLPVHADEPKHKTPFKHLKYRLIGPYAGGRVTRACGVPGDPLTYYLAAAAGGVWKSTDAGNTWKPMFDDQIDSSIGCIAVAPSDPNVVYAGAGEANIRGNVVAGHGIYRSTDGGDNWKQRTENGLPEGDWGRVGIAVAASDPGRVYALIEAEKGGLYRSDDGGEKWSLVSGQHYLRQRPWYFSTITVDPKNADVVYCPTVRLLKSIDGGKSFKQVKGTHHGDHHDLWIDPANPKR